MKRRSRDINVFSMSALDLFASALGAFILIAVVIFPYFPNTGMADPGGLDDALERLREVASGSEELLRIHDELNVAMAGLREEVSSCQHRTEQLQYELQETRERIHALERALEDQDVLRHELAACRQESMSQQAQIMTQQEQISSQQEQIGQQQEQIGQQQEQIARQQEQVAQQQEQVAQQQAQIGEQEGRIVDLERRKFLLVTVSWDGDQGDDVDLHVIDPNGNEYYFGNRTYPDSDARFEEDSLNGPGNEVWLQPQAIPGEYRIYYNPFSLDSSRVEVRGRIVHPFTRHEFRERHLRPDGERELVARVVVDDEGNIAVDEL